MRFFVTAGVAAIITLSTFQIAELLLRDEAGAIHAMLALFMLLLPLAVGPSWEPAGEKMGINCYQQIRTPRVATDRDYTLH